MDRRAFVAGSLGTAVSPTLAPAAGPEHATQEAPPSGRPQLLELRRYRFRFGPMESRFGEFEKGGEIQIFRRVGLTPVFLARNLVGSGLPSLTYMLVFADAAAREKGWAAFREDPGWVKLRSTAGYGNPEILTNIHNVLLRPA